MVFDASEAACIAGEVRIGGRERVARLEVGAEFSTGG